MKDDVAALLSEIDQSENQIKTLKLKIVEKENFLDSLIKREDLLQADLSTDKTAVGDLARYPTDTFTFMHSSIIYLAKKYDLLNLRSSTSVIPSSSHIKALKARVERVKKEKQLRLLEAQFHQYAAAAQKLKGQAAELTSVKNALFNKMQFLNDVIKPLAQTETTNMRLSINSGTASQEAPNLFPETPAAAPVAAEAAPAPAA
jgi:hypothetical protein